MFAKTIAAAPSEFTEMPTLAQRLRSAVRRLLARFAGTAGSAERALVLEDRVAIGPRKALVVVRCHGRRFLVAAAGDTIGPIIEVAPLNSLSRPVRHARRERGV